MNAEAKYFKLGAFVLAAIAIAAGAVVVLGAGAVFRKKLMVETYINESIQGLDVGAPVKFRGVPVGTLEKIEFAGIRYTIPDDRIALVLSFYPETFKGSGDEDPLERLKRMIAGGLRIRLASSGLTSGLYLELENFDPQQHPKPDITWVPRFTYLPSVASTSVRLMARVETVLSHLEGVRVDVISDKVIVLLENVDKVVKTLQPAIEDVRTFTSEATLLVRDTRKVVKEDVGREVKLLMVSIREILEKEVAPALKGLHAAADRLPGTFDKVDKTLDSVTLTVRRVNQAVAEDNGSMEEALDNLRVVTQDLRDLTAQAKRYPSQVLFGEPPPRKGANK